MALRYSNSQFLTVLDPVPLDNIGWYARVLSERDYVSQVALIDRFAGMGFTKEESGVGGGRLVLDAQDRLFTDPLPAGETARVQDQEALIQIIEDGIVRFEFLAEDLLEDQLTESGKLTTEITGRGTGAVLSWAPVLPAGMPNPTSMERTFAAAPLAVWHTLFLEAQADGYLTWVDCLFDGAVDSAGVPWTGAQDVTVQAGGHLLDLLTQFCEAEGYVWRMNAGFRLTVMKDPGQNREGEVVFTMYRDQALQQRLVTRREIGNVVYASSGDGIAVAGDLTSAGRWRKRAKWVQAGGTDASGRSAVANTVLGLSKTEKESRTLQIDPLRPGRRLFTDFDVSDWVGIEIPDGSSSAGSRKVVAISVDIDENAVVKPELTLQSRFEARAIKQQKMLDMLGGGSSTEAGASPIPVSAALSTVRLTDLLDVDLAGAAAGDVLLWDGAKVVDADLNLNLLADVALGSPEDGQLLTFNAAAGVWESADPPAGTGGGGGSPAMVEVYTLVTPTTATASAALDPATKAIDGNTATWWHNNGEMPTWLRVQFAAPTVVRRLTIQIQPNSVTRSPRDFKVQGSTDGTTFTDLTARTGVTWASVSEVKTIDFENATPYLYYRLYVTAGNGDPYIVLAETVFYSVTLQPASSLLATARFGSGTAPVVVPGAAGTVGLLPAAQFPEMAFTLTAPATVLIDGTMFLQTNSVFDVCFAVSTDNFTTFSVGDGYGTAVGSGVVAWPAGWVIQQGKTRTLTDANYQSVAMVPLILSLPAGTYKVRQYKKGTGQMSIADQGGFAMARKL